MIEDMSAFGREARVPADAGAAAWIAARLGEFGTVGGLLPEGFDAYALVRHVDPAGFSDDDALHLAALAERHTATPGTVWFAIWEGHGWAGTTQVVWMRTSPPGRFTSLALAWRRRRVRRSDRRRARAVRRALEEVPTFDLPHRRYHLVGGRLLGVTGLTEPGSTRAQAPDLWWPDDRAWFVASDTDLAWTGVGGPRQLIVGLLDRFGDRAREISRDAPNHEFD